MPLTIHWKVSSNCPLGKRQSFAITPLTSEIMLEHATDKISIGKCH